MRPRPPIWSPIAAGLVAAGLWLGAGGAARALGLETNVTFDQYGPAASNAELARRLLTPLTAAEIPGLLARAGKGLAAQPINLAHERFTLYAPPTPPPGGYGLLVFIPPWPEAKLPKGWDAVLDRFGVIFVTAAGSGNAADVLARREPLALLAEINAAKRYALNPAHIWIAGFSGGARIAMRLALAYPDIFRGAILNAGADPIGDAKIPLPPADLLARFQTASRLVYLTGEQDPERLQRDADSRASMRSWCVQDVRTEIMRGRGHEVADAEALTRALNILEQPASPKTEEAAACQSRIERGLQADLDRVSALAASGRREEALRALKAVDARYGGLAAPRSVELERALSPGF